MKRGSNLVKITYRVHHSNYSVGQAKYLGMSIPPPTEYTVLGRFGKRKGLGFVPIIVKGKVVATPHFTDIKGYFPQKGRSYF